MKQAEIWVDIQGYEGFYQISNWGRVKSIDRIANGKPGVIKNLSGKIISPVSYKGGYQKVKLCKDGNCQRVFIHRLVGIAFIANPHNYPIINHKDLNPHNNNVLNLEWCTHKQNSKHAYDNNRTVPPAPIKGLVNELSVCSKPVIQQSLNGAIVREWPSVMEASRNGFNKGHISSCCNNRLRSHKGFQWSYKN